MVLIPVTFLCNAVSESMLRVPETQRDKICTTQVLDLEGEDVHDDRVTVVVRSWSLIQLVYSPCLLVVMITF